MRRNQRRMRKKKVTSRRKCVRKLGRHCSVRSRRIFLLTVRHRGAFVSRANLFLTLRSLSFVRTCGPELTHLPKTSQFNFRNVWFLWFILWVKLTNSFSLNGLVSREHYDKQNHLFVAGNLKTYTLAMDTNFRRIVLDHRSRHLCKRSLLRDKISSKPKTQLLNKRRRWRKRWQKVKRRRQEKKKRRRKKINLYLLFGLWDNDHY